MLTALTVAFGGALGSLARYGVQLASVRVVGEKFPAGTLAVNLLGSLLLGAIVFLSTEAKTLSLEARFFLGTGVMGGFTTYSTFNAEALAYFRSGAYGLGVVYLVATLVGCLLGGAAGIALARAAVA
jgi:CrcB protein